MVQNSPLVSVIMPAYNAGKYILESIQSVLDQTYQNLELIIINDGSTDHTSRIVSSFKDGRISLIDQNNAGVSAARNRGLDLAKGEYITFLDADDILSQNSLKERVKYLESHPEVDIVDGQIIIKDEEMEQTNRIYEPYYTGELLPRLAALDDKVFFNVCYMFRRELLGDIRFKEGMSHGEDLLFYMDLSRVNDARYGFVDEEVYWYRSGHVSAMQDLKGLEEGYVRLAEYVGLLPNISLVQKLIFRLKIVKIMFLSWLHQKKYLKAFGSVYRILFGVGK